MSQQVRRHGQGPTAEHHHNPRHYNHTNHSSHTSNNRHNHNHHHHYTYQNSYHHQPAGLPPLHPPPSAPLPAPPFSAPAGPSTGTSTSTSSTKAPASATLPPSTGNLIPRDYLGPRPDQLPPSLRAAATAPRKPSPSPLQTTVVPVESPRRYESSSSQSPLSSRSSAASTSPFQNRSPVAQIANAAFPTPPSNASYSLSSQPDSHLLSLQEQQQAPQQQSQPQQQPPKSQPRQQHDKSNNNSNKDIATDERLISTQPRTTPDTTDSLQSITSSLPLSAFGTLPSMAGERPGGHRVMPRTSSIDSAISSLSSASQSNRSTFNANAVSQEDIGNLIAAAGSPEAVIIHLLKEKHHAASQNSQLWRLVDKQRALVLGLNKDLERALKEKEKYKKKVKDSQETSLASLTRARLDDDNTTIASQSSSRQDNQAQSQSRSTSNTRDYYHSSHQQQHRSQQEDYPTDESKNNPAAAMEEAMQGRGDPQNNSQQSMYLQNNKSGSFAANGSSQRNSTDRIPQPMRKPPPAPLNLGGGTIVEQPEPDHNNNDDDNDHDDDVEDAADDDSGSEYEDIVPAEASAPAPAREDRGRKKTREEDDKDREISLMMKEKQQQTRAVSEGKQQQQHQQQQEQNLPPSLPAPNAPMRTGLPASPRPGASQFPPLDRSESLASVLSPRIGHTGSLKENSLMSSAPKSPGLPLSPRPEDRPLGSPLPRMPKEVPGALTPVSIPSDNSNLSGLALSPRATSGSNNNFNSNNNPFTSKEPLSVNVPMSVTPPIPSIDAAVKIDTPRSPMSDNDGIYRGFVSDEYPDLLLPPNALPLIEIKVSSSRLRPSRNSYMALRPTDEEPVFTLSVVSRSDNKELWRVEKVIAALPQLDHQIRPACSFTGVLPDRSIFSGHSPAKIDARRAALTSYFDTLMDTPMSESAALIVCQFLTSDAIEARDDETSLLKNNNQMKTEILRGPDGKPRKEGYLTKRGKNFGGWKARYFVLHGPELRYFEAPGGAHMGTIKIPNAQIGKQSPNTVAQSSSSSASAEDDTDNQYRHAFLILEPKKKDSSALVRHVLCAESDDDRDAWVEALLEYVEGPGHENDSVSSSSGSRHIPPQTPTRSMANGGGSNNNSGSKPRLFSNGAKKNGRGSEGPESEGPDTVQGFSFDDAVPAEPPILGTTLDKPPPLKSPTFPSSPGGFPEVGHHHSALDQNPLSPYPAKVISGPTNGAVIQNAGAWGNKATSNKEKKRSIWGFRTRSSMDLASQLQQAERESPTGHINEPIAERREIIRPVFGIPLAEAVQDCSPEGVDVELPAVVYRCIEYLRAKGAASEEGIFRLSGSNVVVKALKERFNTEGDIDFCAGDQYYDVHAVASLFKQYLRELPSTVLTRELHLEFLRVLELDDRDRKIAAFNYLVHQLPKPNLTLLRALSQFLIEIVNNSDVNKMTVRNVGIVFAPTLNIPAPVFSMFLTDFESIFDEIPGSGNIKTTELTVERPRTATGGRSPRRQVFSDMPATASYGQTAFPRHDGFPGSQFSDPRAQYDTGFSPAQPNFPASDYNSFASANQMLNPSLGDARASKAKKRESSMLFMDTQHLPQMPSSPYENPLSPPKEASP